jgi:hypothetical protein
MILACGEPTPFRTNFRARVFFDSRESGGKVSGSDPDVLKPVNANRSGVFTFADAARWRLKEFAQVRAMPRCADPELHGELETS